MIFSMSFCFLKMAVISVAIAVTVSATLVTSISCFASALEVPALESVNLRVFMLNTK